MWPKWQENKPFTLALLILIAYAAVFLWVLGQKTIAETRQVGKPVPYEHTIVIEGFGKVLGKPDLATVSFGIDTRGADVASAQIKNTELMNALIQQVKGLGIPEDDVQTTNYNVYQESIWNPDTSTYDLGEWVVSQSVTVKVRDTSKISPVIQLAGQNGATNISGPTFTIDDPTSLKAEARAEALQDAQVKAMALAKTLGLRIERVVGYTEYENGGPIPYYNYAKSYAMDVAAAAPAPEIAVGTNEVSLTVSVTYKLVD